MSTTYGPTPADLEIVIVMVEKAGAGHHWGEVLIAHPNMWVTRGRLVYALAWSTNISNGLSRMSIVALYLRIFTIGMTRWVSWGILLYLIGIVLSQMMTMLVQYKSLRANWDDHVREGLGIDIYTFYQVFGILSIVADVAIMITPVYSIWKLQASAGRKTGIAIVFGSGSL